MMRRTVLIMSLSPFGYLRIGANGKLYCGGCELCAGTVGGAFTWLAFLSEAIGRSDVPYLSVDLSRMALKLLLP
jgi:hypothetical protein